LWKKTGEPTNVSVALDMTYGPFAGPNYASMAAVDLPVSLDPCCASDAFSFFARTKNTRQKAASLVQGISNSLYNRNFCRCDGGTLIAESCFVTGGTATVQMR